VKNITMRKGKKRQLLDLLVERGIADCIRSASEMVQNNEVMIDGVPVKERNLFLSTHRGDDR